MQPILEVKSEEWIDFPCSPGHTDAVIQTFPEDTSLLNLDEGSMMPVDSEISFDVTRMPADSETSFDVMRSGSSRSNSRPILSPQRYETDTAVPIESLTNSDVVRKTASKGHSKPRLMRQMSDLSVESTETESATGMFKASSLKAALCSTQFGLKSDGLGFESEGSTTLGGFGHVLSGGKRLKGAIVEIDPVQLPMEAFEIEDAVTDSKTAAHFTYKRHNKNAVYLNLGLTTVKESFYGQQDTTDSIDHVIAPYTKENQKICMDIYMSYVLSYCLLTMPSCLADCGCILGLACILFIGFMQSFWVSRLIEVPALLRTNLEKYGDVARKLCSNTTLQGIIIFMIAATWFGYVTEAYYNITYYSGQHKVKKRFGATWSNVHEAAVFAILVPMSLRTTPDSIKGLQRNAQFAMRALWSICALLSLCSVVHGCWNFQYVDYSLAKTDMARFARGAQNICFGYAGMQIVPYVVSEMLHPEQARAVMFEASNKITVCYATIAIVGYFGWGIGVDYSMVKSIEREQYLYLYFAAAIELMVVVKCVATYPIMFVPLFREVEGYFQFEDSPPVAMGLPWALRQRRRLRNLIKVAIVLSTALLHWVFPRYFLTRNIIYIPALITQLVLPPIFGMLAVHSYRKRVLRSPDAHLPHVFGTKHWQFLVMIIFAVLSVGLGIFLVIAAVSDLWDMGKTQYGEKFKVDYYSRTSKKSGADDGNETEAILEVVG